MFTKHFIDTMTRWQKVTFPKSLEKLGPGYNHYQELKVHGTTEFYESNWFSFQNYCITCDNKIIRGTKGWEAGHLLSNMCMTDSKEEAESIFK
jgi:hypothetical protein